MTTPEETKMLEEIQRIREDPVKLRMCVKETMAWTAQNHCVELLYELYGAHQCQLLQALKEGRPLNEIQQAQLVLLDQAMDRFREDLDKEIELWACAQCTS